MKLVLEMKKFIDDMSSLSYPECLRCPLHGPSEGHQQVGRLLCPEYKGPKVGRGQKVREMNNKIVLAHLKFMKEVSDDLGELFKKAEPMLCSAMGWSLNYIDNSIQRLEDLILGKDSDDFIEDFFWDLEHPESQ